MIMTSIMKELKAYLRPCQTFMTQLFVPTTTCNKLRRSLEEYSFGLLFLV